MKAKPSEQGAALLSVLMLVSVISLLATISLRQLGAGTRAATNFIALDQARSDTQGAEALALVAVSDLSSKAGAMDPRQFNRVVDQPTDHGTIIARLGDGGNCFNLNAMVSRSSDGQTFANPTGMAQFARLIRVTGVDARTAAQLSAALADWMDSDGVPLPGGAEDASYMHLDHPYLPANTLMADRSELRTVAGVSDGLYRRIRPLLCALPTTDPAIINVNTLTLAHAPLIAAMISAEIEPAVIQQAIATRPASGFASVDAFWRQLAGNRISPTPDAVQQTDTRTRWFQLDLDVRRGDAQLHEVALIDAALRPARLIRRTWGEVE
jgi:general secretion pathway protein K